MSFEIWEKDIIDGTWHHNADETYANYPSACREVKGLSTALPTMYFRILDTDWDETYTFQNGKQLGRKEAERLEPVAVVAAPLEEWELELLNASKDWEPAEEKLGEDSWYESGFATADAPNEPLADWERALLDMPTSVRLSNGETYSLSDFDH
jgi:hypothetical protein